MNGLTLSHTRGWTQSDSLVLNDEQSFFAHFPSHCHITPNCHLINRFCVTHQVIMHPEPVIETTSQHFGRNRDPELAAGKGSPVKRFHDARARLALAIHARHAYIPLLICCFVSGMLDSTLYSGECQLEPLTSFDHNLI
jgi:hypothetical protein